MGAAMLAPIIGSKFGPAAAAAVNPAGFVADKVGGRAGALIDPHKAMLENRQERAPGSTAAQSPAPQGNAFVTGGRRARKREESLLGGGSAQASLIG